LKIQWYIPRSRGYGDITVMYIRRSEIPSHISTGKNQSTKIHGVLYISTYEYNYKVIKECDTILQEYCIIDRRKYENTRRYTKMNSTKDAPELQKENSGNEQGGLEGWGSRRSAEDSRFLCAALISNWKNPQDLNSEI